MTGNKTPGMHAPRWKSFQLYQSDRVADIICERSDASAPWPGLQTEACRRHDRSDGTTSSAVEPLWRRAKCYRPRTIPVMV